jgi:endo-1,4-beta-mannosidase
MDRFSGEFFLGINYWGSESAINMWSCFNPASIEEDMRLMQDAGVTHLRVFPLWPVFQPLHAIYGPNDVYEYAFGEEPLPDTPAGRAGVSEEACGNFERFCRIAEKYGMKLIVGLITGHMSFRTYNPPAFRASSLSRISVPRPANAVATVTRPHCPAPAMISASRA